MSEPFIGQIATFAFNFAPRFWAICSGQLLPIAQNMALFSLLGTQYGGNGTTNFALPDLRGRAGLNGGQGPGLSSYTIGQVGGVENVTLTLSQIPQHTHTWTATTLVGNQPSPANNFLAGGVVPSGTQIPAYAPAGGAVVPLAADTLATVGSSSGHPNMQPFLVMNYCIALSGIFPSRN